MLGEQNRTNFNLVLSLDPKIFAFAQESIPETIPEELSEELPEIINQ